jgi:hypothetical protein
LARFSDAVNGRAKAKQTAGLFGSPSFYPSAPQKMSAFRVSGTIIPPGATATATNEIGRASLDNSHAPLPRTRQRRTFMTDILVSIF